MREWIEHNFMKFLKKATEKQMIIQQNLILSFPQQKEEVNSFLLLKKILIKLIIMTILLVFIMYVIKKVLLKLTKDEMILNFIYAIISVYSYRCRKSILYEITK